MVLKILILAICLIVNIAVIWAVGEAFVKILGGKGGWFDVAIIAIIVVIGSEVIISGVINFILNIIIWLIQ